MIFSGLWMWLDDKIWNGHHERSSENRREKANKRWAKNQKNERHLWQFKRRFGQIILSIRPFRCITLITHRTHTPQTRSHLSIFLSIGSFDSLFDWRSLIKFWYFPMWKSLPISPSLFVNCVNFTWKMCCT